ncbi:MAG: molybdopterin-guanine dinucleotide biosynthesis protein B [Candidatus Electrothrix aestuarii]|uniref:Molybdopterin-guanine dinucleotide biosynthesis protein B n=1 Tax=Candidatus Electrothrix aestuarii TaxID=3062594 RepID=A0AAU8LTA9_9BACT|nr:molybdopterin-guanine dinucleotide biosynthesis protein B [Candidatus Electrothrix aestuarii]
MPPIITFIGWHDSGKTTLAAQVVRLLKERGYTVAVIKSTKDTGVLPNQDGTDTGAYSQAGADAVTLVAPDQLVMMAPQPEKNLPALARRFFADMDLVIGEGFKEADKVGKIEVFRGEGTRLTEQVSGVLAVATDQDLADPLVFALNQPEKIADFLEKEYIRVPSAHNRKVHLIKTRQGKAMNSMQSFTVTQPTRLQFGAGTVKDLGKTVKDFNGSKVLLVVDPGLVKAGLLERFTVPLEQEEIPFVVYDQIDPEPGLKLADKGCAIAQEAGCDCVVGAGGGSAMDVAKAVSILLTNGGKAVDYLGLGLIKKPGVPKIMVPTSAGTGAEVTFTAVFINEETGSKGGMNGDPLYPDAAILDPELTLSLPAKVTAYTGIDALTHALEAYTSTQAHVVSEMYSLEAIELIARNLPAACANGGNLEARAAMLMGSLLGGKALATAGVGLVHAMAYPMGGMFGVPHGLANAVLLPYVVQYNLPGNYEKFALLAEVLGQNTDGLSRRDAASLCVEALYDLNADVGIPATLKDLDIPFDQIPKMAEIALTVTRPVENNPRQPSLADVIAVYERAYRHEIVL